MLRRASTGFTHRARVEEIGVWEEGICLLGRREVQAWKRRASLTCPLIPRSMAAKASRMTPRTGHPGGMLQGEEGGVIKRGSG